MTLNQVIARLSYLATGHKQVKHFAYNDAVTELNDNADINYPAIIVTDNGILISRTLKQTQIIFNVYVIDLLDNAKRSLQNELDVFSDCLSIAMDYVAMINSSTYDDWYVGTEQPAQLVKEAFTDYVGGIMFTITIGIDFLSDRCQVPTDIIFETQV
jgi:hypothetical protein